jgi:hypothetical protein
MNMKKLIIILLVAFAGTAVAQKAGVMVTDKDGWHKIGETTANFKTDRDAIVVMGADRFKSIKLKVTDASIDLQDLEIYYEKEAVDKDKKVDGTKMDSQDMKDALHDDVQVRTPMKAGEESRIIPVKSDHDLKKVVFTYRTIPNTSHEKANVELWGLK